jgi:hypothetical protein
MTTQADCQGDLALAAWRANASAVLPASLDGAALVLPVAGQQAVALAESCPAADSPRRDGLRGVTQCRSNRQSERQNHGKRRTSGLQRGPRGASATS